MDIIYIDSLFLINFIVDYFILLCSAKVASAMLRRGWIALGAVLGGLYACVCVLPDWAFAVHPLVKLSVGGLMCLAAFHSERQLLRCTLIFFAVSAGFGGIVWAASLMGGVSTSGGVLYVPMNGKVLAVTFAAAYVLISALFRRFDRTVRRAYYTVEAELFGRNVTFTALRDTGNELFDPVSGSAVMVCQRSVLAPLMGISETELPAEDPARAFEALSQRPALSARLRLIPFQSVGAAGLMLAVRPERLTIDGQAQSNVLLAITAGKLSTFNEYQAIY